LAAQTVPYHGAKGRMNDRPDLGKPKMTASANNWSLPGIRRHVYRPLTDQLASCKCCPRQCGVNRLAGKAGYCKVGADVLISHAGLHFGEEPSISGTRGSGTIFFAGCNLRCVFCQNYQISQEFQQGRTRTLTPDELVSEMLRLQDQGAHNINFVSPSHMIFQMADAIQAARAKGLALPVVYNSNGYDGVDALRQIRGLVDIYLPDIKYLENEPGKRFSKVDDYAEVVPEVLREMLDQVGHLETDEDGIAVRGLLVRHLVLPGCLDNSRRCLRFLADLSPDIAVSIMSQYSPQYKARHYPQINRPLTQDEYDEIIDYALDLGLEHALIQELESQAHYLPDFDQERPFTPAATR
jgi:putative pyruvate formate lyase activating enzyme